MKLTLDIDDKVYAFASEFIHYMLEQSNLSMNVAIGAFAAHMQHSLQEMEEAAFESGLDPQELADESAKALLDGFFFNDVGRAELRDFFEDYLAAFNDQPITSSSKEADVEDTIEDTGEAPEENDLDF